MEATTNNSAALYVGWEEVVVSKEKGRREVHYFLKRSVGGGDLVVVGKEKSVRHMSYRYAIKSSNSLFANLNRSWMWKLRSRRDVISWINSILSVSDGQTNDSLGQLEGVMESKLDDDVIKVVLTRTDSQYMSQFMWLGSPWTCRKRRKHYKSLRRNGVIISAQDFVYVLAEEDKRLVAYLDDMYEDTRGKRMAVVRWFHKIDEIGFVLPLSYNDREIFFSLCLQDLSIECLDGLATVLCPEHYEKYRDQATHMGLEPFVCCRQFDNDDLKPFDITSIKGYWKQGLLRNVTASLFERSADDLKAKGSVGDAITCRSYKRIRWSKESDFVKSPNERKTDSSTPQVRNGSSFHSKGGVKLDGLKEGCSYVSSSGQDDAAVPTCENHLSIGSSVEVLSQDSGLRGCWFRALIIKKHKDKVKLQYQDVKDAADDSKNLEEWMLASRLAAPDKLGIRVSGRIMVRPIRSSDEYGVSGGIDVGSVVDAWCHDGWWEGIVLKKESDGRVLVYFPGEMQKQIFNSSDLRHSKEWINNGWLDIKGRPELVPTFSGTNKPSDVDRESAPVGNLDLAAAMHIDSLLQDQGVVKIVDSMACEDEKMQNKDKALRNLLKDSLFCELHWGSSKKRSCRSPVQKSQFGAHGDNGNTGMQSLNKFFVSSSLKFDPDNCKYASDSQFSATRLTSLVMSS